MGGRKLPFHWILGNVTWCKRDEEIQENYKIFLPVKRTKSTKTIGAGFSFYKKEYEKTGAKQNLSWLLTIQEKIDEEIWDKDVALFSSQPITLIIRKDKPAISQSQSLFCITFFRYCTDCWYRSFDPIVLSHLFPCLIWDDLRSLLPHPIIPFSKSSKWRP